MAEFKYEVVETYGSLSESSKGWKKEIKLISWNQKEAVSYTHLTLPTT